MKRSIVALAGWFITLNLAACSALQPGPAPSATFAATASQTPTQTASATQTPVPSATATATLVPTPDLSWIQAAPAATVEFRLPLTIRHLTETSAVLQFELEQKDEARLLVWRLQDNGGLRQIASQEGGGVFEINDLQPGVEYQAAVLVEGETPARPLNLGEVWPLVRFKTMDFEQPSFTAAVFGDSGFGDNVTRGIAQQIAAEEVDMVLHTGDIVYRVDENQDAPTAFKLKLFQTLQPILVNLPFYPVAGNHEYDFPARWQDQPYYYHAFPQVESEAIEFPTASDGSWYAIVQDGIQFLMVNSQSIFGEPGEQEQRSWLLERVNDPEVRYSVVVIHVPPYTLGSHQTGAAAIRSRWGDLLINDRVPLVLSGHDHNYQRWQIGSTTLVVSGGGSAVLYELSGGDPNYRAGGRISHHVLVNFGQEAIELSAIDREGNVIDEAYIQTP